MRFLFWPNIATNGPRAHSQQETHGRAHLAAPPSSKLKLEALRFQFRIFLSIEAEEISLPSLRRVGCVARQLEHTKAPHLVIEIAAIEAHIEDGLIEVLQLLDGELLWQQFKPHRLEMNLLAQRLFRLTENLVVVESQRRHFVKGKPSRVGRTSCILTSA